MKPISLPSSLLERSGPNSLSLAVITCALIFSLAGCSSQAYKSTPTTEDAQAQEIEKTNVEAEISKSTPKKTPPAETVSQTKEVAKQATETAITVKKTEKKQPSKKTTKAKKKTEDTTKTKQVATKQKASTKTKKAAKKTKPTSSIKAPISAPKPEPVAASLPGPKEAPQEEAKTEAKESPTPSLVSLDALPINIAGKWTLDRELNQANTQSCFLSYAPQQMQDGQGSTPVHLKVTHDSIVLKTKSNIDTSYPAAGLTVDSNTQIPIEKLFNISSIIYKEHYTKAIKQMTEGKQATFAIGFWPTWPVTQTYPVSFDLTNFAAAYSSLQSCLALEQQLK